MLNKLLITLTLIAGSITPTLASSMEDPLGSPRRLIEQAVEKLNPIVTEGQAYYQEDPQRLYRNVSMLLETFFDFDAFARGVMGNHFSSASSQQKTNFATVLKGSLVKTFTDGLIGMGAYTVDILPSALPKPEAEKAKVTMRVTSGEKTKHELSYSLSRGKKKLWRVRNLVFDGVNIGLTFRSQFDNQIRNRTGNIEDVINHWEINIDQ